MKTPSLIHSQMDSSNSLLVVIFVLLLNCSKLVQSDDDLIRQTCKNTQYSDLCFSSLKSDPSSSESDLKGLATIMVNLGIANSTETYSYLSSKLSTSSNNGDSSVQLKKVFRLCAVKYSYATDSLKSSLQDLSMENYDYASIHVTAAMDYPNSCRNGFKRFPGLGYPNEIKSREDGLKRICAVVLGILEQISSTDVHSHV